MTMIAICASLRLKPAKINRRGRGDVIHCSASNVLSKSVPDSSPPEIWTHALRDDRDRNSKTAPLPGGAFHLDGSAVSGGN